MYDCNRSCFFSVNICHGWALPSSPPSIICFKLNIASRTKTQGRTKNEFVQLKYNSREKEEEDEEKEKRKKSKKVKKK